MKASVSDAKGQLTDLVRRVVAAEEIVLTRHGHAAARPAPIRPMPSPGEAMVVALPGAVLAERRAIFQSVPFEATDLGPARSQTGAPR